LDNKEILKQLGSKGKGEETAKKKQKLYKYLLVKVGEKSYGIPTHQVREIIMNHEIYFVPFVPPYITGYLNRQGEPYIVFDLGMLFENRPLTPFKFLVLNMEEDQVAFMIDDVLTITTVPENEVHGITSSEVDMGYFSATITFHDENVFILNVAQILERLENDL